MGSLSVVRLLQNRLDMKSLYLAALVAVTGIGCSGESLGGLGAVTLELTAVDGKPLPAAVGSTGTGVALLAIAGELVGQPSGSNCTYVIQFRPSTGGSVTSVNGTIAPEPCVTQPGASQTVTVAFTRADLPTGSHTYKFE